MKQLVVVIMGQDCKDFAELCINSVNGADAVVFCDGGSKPEFLDWLREQHLENGDITIIQQEFSQTDPLMNSKQRNFYLNYLKQQFRGWWALCLDADEVVHDISKIKEFIQTANERQLFSPKMRHFIYHFGLEDATVPEHWVPQRLFYVQDGIEYPPGEHASLQGLPRSFCNATTIWHLAYAPLFHIRNRWRKNTKHSEVHSKEFLRQWRNAHLFGNYPVSPVNPKDLPAHLLKGYDIDPDSLYFSDRGLEVKHFIDAGHWRDFFNPNGVIEFGCGLGPRVLAMQVCGLDAEGVEISKFAVEHAMTKHIFQGDITEQRNIARRDLVVAYDLLEHISYDKLGAAIDNLISCSSRHILVSVPTLGDPNLTNDDTHKIFESKEWWERQFTDKGCKKLLVPEHFLYREQLMIWEVPDAS